jgi:hypothetical protein
VGIKLFFKNESYGLPKELGLRHHLLYEARALKNFAEIVSEMITGNTNPLAMDIPGFDPELKCILDECYRAEEKLEAPDLTG